MSFEMMNSTKFQSTHPVWGATCALPRQTRRRAFQSTHPVWGATNAARLRRLKTAISIHAPRMGCDPQAARCRSVCTHFNPRTPYGVRLKKTCMRQSRLSFQSTHPVWGATLAVINAFCAVCISIHAPRMGCDRFAPRSLSATLHFNPRTPYGVRPALGDMLQVSEEFQSTHPVWGATLLISV